MAFPSSLLGIWSDKTTLWTVPSASSTPTSATSSTGSQTPAGLQKTESTSSSSTYRKYFPSPTSDATLQNDNNDGFLDGLEGGTKAAIGVGITAGVLIIVVLSIWYCCGCCGLRARRRKRLEGSRAPPINQQRPVPLRTMHTGDTTGVGVAGDAPPPLYEEAVPPQHRHIAGGVTHVREEEEGIISDGKTPLSEIPFEDVVLDHSPSEGSSRSFRDRHHGLGGDTTGHTNS